MRTAILFVALHTAVVVLGVRIALQNGTFPGKLFFAAIVIVILASILYTAYMIVQKTKSGMERHMKDLLRPMAELLKLAAVLREYAQRIEHQDALMTEYSNKISELTELIDTAKDSSAQDADVLRRR